MSPEITVLLAVLVFATLILAEVPIAFGLLIAGTGGIIALGGMQAALSTLAAVPYSAVAKYDLLILPMFILLGAVVANAGIATRIYAAANRIVGWLPGGLAVTTVFACTLFGGISGSSAADVAALGRVSINEMRAHGYAAKFAAGLVAAAGMVAILIPPSIPLVIYGIITGVPIGELLIAGIIPGLMSAVLFAIYAMIYSRLRPPQPVPAVRTDAARAPVMRGRVRTDGSLSGFLCAAILFTIVVGGIYAGLLTSTEAAAVGAFAAIVIAAVMAWIDRRPFLPIMRTSMAEAAEMSAMVFALLIGSAVFTYFISLSGIPSDLARWTASQSLSPSMVVISILLLLVPLGMFLDGLSMLLLTVPVVYPIVRDLGIDGVWFGILVVTMIELGLITPPVGLNVYVAAGLVDDLALEDVFVGVAPFIVIQILVTALIFTFPDIALWLPRMAFGG